MSWKSQWKPTGDEDILIVDNRDSFVFNLAHRFYEIGRSAAVIRSDEVDLEDIERWSPAGLVISPGPGHPDDAGISVEAVRRFGNEIPILGVCLGHQAVAVAFGAVVEAGGRPVHGKATGVEHNNQGLFSGLPDEFPAGRYHSLVVTECPKELVVDASAEGFVMGIRHRCRPIYGVQFHPESVLTPLGKRLLNNFGAVVDRQP